MFKASLYLRFWEAVGASLYRRRWVILSGAILMFISLIFAPTKWFPVVMLFILVVIMKFYLEISCGLSSDDSDGGSLSSDGGGDGGGGGGGGGE